MANFGEHDFEYEFIELPVVHNGVTIALVDGICNMIVDDDDNAFYLKNIEGLSLYSQKDGQEVAIEKDHYLFKQVLKSLSKLYDAGHIDDPYNDSEYQDELERRYKSQF